MDNMTAEDLAADISNQIAGWLYQQSKAEKPTGNDRRILAAALAASISESTKRELWFQLLPKPIEAPSGMIINKHEWFHLAELIGADHAQHVYHGAVFMTKVA